MRHTRREDSPFRGDPVRVWSLTLRRLARHRLQWSANAIYLDRTFNSAHYLQWGCIRRFDDRAKTIIEIVNVPVPSMKQCAGAWATDFKMAEALETRPCTNLSL